MSNSGSSSPPTRERSCGRLPRPRCFAGTETGVAAGLVLPEELSELRGPRQSLGELPPAEPAGTGEDLLRAAEAFEQRLLGQSNLRKLYDCFPQIDEVAYPLELSSELRGRDQVRTVRISTLDSKRGFAKKFSKKLCGRQLGGFGGFFKASWRANDLMWGRIDGVSQLLDLVLDTKRLAQLAPELLHSNLQKVLGEAFDLRSVFPHSPDADRQLLEGWLRSICRPETARSAREALDHGPLLRECWARAVQLEIVVEELPVVLELAQCEDAPASDKATLAAQWKAFQASSPLQVGASAAAYFNPEQYRIGEESLPSALRGWSPERDRVRRRKPFEGRTPGVVTRCHPWPARDSRPRQRHTERGAAADHGALAAREARRSLTPAVPIWVSAPGLHSAACLSRERCAHSAGAFRAGVEVGFAYFVPVWGFNRRLMRR